MDLPLTKTRHTNYCSFSIPRTYTQELVFPTLAPWGQVHLHVCGLVMMGLASILMVYGPPTFQFITSCLLLVPICGYFSFFLDRLNCYFNLTAKPGLTALLLYSLGNLPELLVSSLALTHGQSQLTRDNNVGSVVVNLILVTGCVYSLAIRVTPIYPRARIVNNPISQPESLPVGPVPQLINTTPTTATAPTIVASPLEIAVILLIPMGCYGIIERIHVSDWKRLQYSHGVALGLVVTYIWMVAKGKITSLYRTAGTRDPPVLTQTTRTDRCLTVTNYGFGLVFMVWWLAFISQTLITSIKPAVTKLSLPTRLVNLVIIPLLSNVVEVYQAVRFARTGNIVAGLALGLGSVIQVLWFIYPTVHLIGWVGGYPMALTVSVTQTGILGVSCLLFLTLLPNKMGGSRYTGITMLLSYLGWCIYTGSQS